MKLHLAANLDYFCWTCKLTLSLSKTIATILFKR
jgi:hypothetical protein